MKEKIINLSYKLLEKISINNFFAKIYKKNDDWHTWATGIIDFCACMAYWQFLDAKVARTSNFPAQCRTQKQSLPTMLQAERYDTTQCNSFFEVRRDPFNTVTAATNSVWKCMKSSCHLLHFLHVSKGFAAKPQAVGGGSWYKCTHIKIK